MKSFKEYLSEEDKLTKNITDNNVSFSIVRDNSMAIAELGYTIIEPYAEFIDDKERLNDKWFFFNRLNTPARIRKQGFAAKLMDEVVGWADDKKINIINTINPYGDMNMTQLITFYKKYGFVEAGPEKGLMIRYFK